MGREFSKDELHLSLSFFPEPNQCDFIMILIPFNGLMAAFPTMDGGSGHGCFLWIFPLGHISKLNAPYTFVRVLSSRISNVPARQCPVGRRMQ